MKRKAIALSISKEKIHKQILTEAEWKKIKDMAKFEGVAISRLTAMMYKEKINRMSFLWEE